MTNWDLHYAAYRLLEYEFVNSKCLISLDRAQINSVAKSSPNTAMQMDSDRRDGSRKKFIRNLAKELLWYKTICQDQPSARALRIALNILPFLLHKKLEKNASPSPYSLPMMLLFEHIQICQHCVYMYEYPSVRKTVKAQDKINNCELN